MSYDLMDEYRARAAAAPWDHRIPWNCPTFYDGCNCREMVRALDPIEREKIAAEVDDLRTERKSKRHWAEMEDDIDTLVRLLDALTPRELLDDYQGPSREAHEWLVEYGVRRG